MFYSQSNSLNLSGSNILRSKNRSGLEEAGVTADISVHSEKAEAFLIIRLICRTPNFILGCTSCGHTLVWGKGKGNINERKTREEK